MRLRRVLTIVVALMLAVIAKAQPASISMIDAARHQVITATAISPDIVRVDVVPQTGKAVKLTSLLCPEALQAPAP